MPYPLWKHGPCCSDRTWLSSQPACTECNRPGVFDGWHLSMHEAMAQYQYVYGLKPLGPHRALADGLLTPLRAGCSRCDGRGIVTIAGGEWLACARCEGTGGTWAVSDLTLQATMATVLDRFPAAAAPEVPSDFLSGTAVLDLDSQSMRGARGRRSRHAASVQVADPRQPPAPPAAAAPPAATPPPAVAPPHASDTGRGAYWWLWLAAVLVRGLVAMASR